MIPLRLWIGLLLGVAAGGAAAATANGGVYTAAQADTGKVVYDAECARCHGPDLNGGGGGPALAGPFWGAWEGRNMAELFNLTKQSMPADGPGRLSDEEYAAILAYMLKVDGRPTGGRPMAHDLDALSGIEITAP